MTLKNLRLFALVTILSVVICSCEKPGVPPDVSPPAPKSPIELAVGGTAPLPIAHDGAFYAIRSMNFDSTGVLDTSLMAFAWFGNSDKTESAGKVYLNDSSLLSNAGNWYTGPSKYYGSEMYWMVEGTEKFPAFQFEDLSEFGSLQSKAIPPTINRNQGITASFNTTGVSAAVIVSVNDSAGHWATKTVGSGLQTVTFTNKELATLLVSAKSLVFQIMPVTTNFQTIGSKNYYFVKQASYKKIIWVND